jgi:hypothetical protein
VGGVISVLALAAKLSIPTFFTRICGVSQDPVVQGQRLLTALSELHKNMKSVQCVLNWDQVIRISATSPKTSLKLDTTHPHYDWLLHKAQDIETAVNRQANYILDKRIT